jgi:hypothetical protein
MPLTVVQHKPLWVKNMMCITVSALTVLHINFLPWGDEGPLITHHFAALFPDQMNASMIFSPPKCGSSNVCLSFYQNW